MKTFSFFIVDEQRSTTCAETYNINILLDFKQNVNFLIVPVFLNSSTSERTYIPYVFIKTLNANECQCESETHYSSCRHKQRV